MNFWDSSALVPLLVEQELTSKVIRFHKNNSKVVAWWGSSLECTTALSRLEREGKIGEPIVYRSLKLLDELRSSWIEIKPVEEILQIAKRLVRTHSLRSADSLQLAAAIVASQKKSPFLPMFCLDDRLCSAARREGFAVVDGSQLD